MGWKYGPSRRRGLDRKANSTTVSRHKDKVIKADSNKENVVRHRMIKISKLLPAIGTAPRFDGRVAK
jgi:hypothetical protein